MTNDVRQVVERIREELRINDELWGRDVQTKRQFVNTARLSVADMRLLVEAIASPPAPSGWQQRIAARLAELADHGSGICEAFRPHMGHGDCATCGYSSDLHLLRDIATAEGQNAKDALPPQSESWQSNESCACFCCRESGCQPGCACSSAVQAACQHVMTDDGECRKCGSEADASPAKDVAFPLWGGDGPGHSCSPAKDPIADAVHADLAPLAGDLIDAGHKLVPRCPQCFTNAFVRLVADASHAEAPEDAWECSTCGDVFTTSEGR